MLVRNDGPTSATVSGKVRVESTPVFPAAWGCFHALCQRTHGHDHHG